MSSKRRNAELGKLARDFRVAPSHTDEAIYDFLSALDCSKSLAIWLLFKHGEHQQLVDLDIDPMDYNSPYRYRQDYTAWAFLSKADFFKLAVSKERAAFDKFFKYEELCKSTNIRFSKLALDPLHNGSNVWLLNATIRKITNILRGFSPEEFVDGANWGPGVTTLLKGEHVSAVNKFHSENGITQDLYSLVEPWFATAYPCWSAHLTLENGEQWANFQVGNSIVTVPKNSKTDRVIAAEPGMNLWFQKGIGTMIRTRLRRWGIDLDHQHGLHNVLAKRASHDASLTTVDFSSASDSISKEVVRNLLSQADPAWLQVMEASRCTLGKHNATLIRWEKFSSMGNGFTFELETLIFFAAALAVCEYMGVPQWDSSGIRVSVFGDDVILPTECYDLFSSFTQFLGFKVNVDKTYSTSYFRESCGAHWFDGVDCKPIFLKERLSDVQSIYKLANSIRHLGHRRNSHYGCDSRFRNAWHHLLRRVPKPLRLCIPLGKGDGGFISNFDEAAPAISRATLGVEGYFYTSMAEVGVSQHFEREGLSLARLKAISTQTTQHSVLKRGRAGRLEAIPLEDRAYKNNYTLRDKVKIVLTRSLASRWYDLGPWI